MKKPKNKIIDFGVASSCNYNCNYCIGINSRKGKLLKKKIQDNPGKVNILFKKTLKKLEGRWIFNLGGPGEPFLIPNFLKLVKKIVRNNHKIKVITNFSASEKDILEFCEIAGKQLVRLNASLHLEHADLDEFLKKSILINKKIGRQKFSVISVARKGNVSQLKEIGQKFRNEGIIFTMQLERSADKKGRVYSDYNKKELEIIKNFRRIIQSKEDLKFKGRLCWSGCYYFITDYKGESWRCYPAKKNKDPDGYLGNLIEGTFKLRKTASSCLYSYCFCINPVIFKLIKELEE